MARVRGDRSWQLVTTLAAIGSTMAAKKVVDMAWVTAKGAHPPDSPEDEETSWQEALAFAAVTGVIAAVVRLTITRRAARHWTRGDLV